MKKLLIPIFGLILLLPLCLAVKETTIQLSGEGDNELVILYPRIQIYGQHKVLNLNYMVLNSSGNRLNATKGEVSCWFGLQNSSNDILIFTENSQTNNFFFSQPIPANKSGIYSYAIWCNSTEGEYGYVADTYHITDFGVNYPPGTNGMTSIVLIVGIFAVVFILSYIAFKVDKEKHFFLQLIILLFVVVVLHLIPKAVLDYTQAFGTGLIFYKAVLWFVRIFWGYILFYIFYELGYPLLKKLRVK